MRKYLLYTMVAGLMSVLAFTSCKKSAPDVTFPLPGTVWIGNPIYDLLTNRYYNGDVTHVMTLTSQGTAKILTVDNHTLRTTINVTANKAATWTADGTKFDLTTSALGISGPKSYINAPSPIVLKGSLSYENENINFAYGDTTFLAFDMVRVGTSPLASKVFRGTFLKAGATVPVDCVWIFLSDKGWQMIVPNFPVTVWPLSKWNIETGNVLHVDYFGGTASSSVPIDYKNHSGIYTPANDSIVYNTTAVPAANVYGTAYTSTGVASTNQYWKGVFRLKEVK